MDNDYLDTKIDIEYMDSFIIFRIPSVTFDKKYTFSNLNREESEIFIKKIKYIENMKWNQWVSIDRKKFGLTGEIIDSKSFDLVKEKDHREEIEFGLTKRYYFHFRIDYMRIFGYQDREYFYITHIDTKLSIHKH